MTSGTDFLGSRTGPAMFLMILGPFRDRFTPVACKNPPSVLPGRAQMKGGGVYPDQGNRARPAEGKGVRGGVTRAPRRGPKRDPKLSSGRAQKGPFLQGFIRVFEKMGPESHPESAK